ncbi:hypothetical protein X975_00329, partial [Stegodyphus mimosarum]
MALIITLLWQYLGIACLAGISVMLLIMPFPVHFVKRILKHLKRRSSNSFHT